MNLKNKNIDIFNPFILIVMVILFLLLAFPMWYSYGKLPSPKISISLYIFVGLLFFAFGIFLSNFIVNKYNDNRGNKNNQNNNGKDNNSLTNKIKSYLFSDNINGLNSKNPEKSSLFGSYSKKELVLVSLVSVGILLQVINIVHLGGIPLFDANLKAQAASKIWLLSYIIFLPFINILLAEFNRDSHYILLFLGLLLFALTGYRTTPIAILLSIFITLFYTRNIKFKHQVMFFVGIIIILIAIGFIAVQAISWQNWSLNPIELVSYRAAFTLNILQRAIEHQFITGGNLFYSTLTGFFTHVDPRNLVGIAVLGRDHSITSTIFGPALLDFGLVGMLVQMFFIGFILKTLHSIQKVKKEVFAGIYGVLLAQTIIWIETGPTDVVVWLFYLIGIFLIIFSFYKRDSFVV